MAMADGQANENESANALECAHRLMKEHGIEMLDLHGEDDLKIDASVWESPIRSQIDTYSHILADATAKLFECEWWILRLGASVGYKVQLCFAGDEIDLLMASDVWPWLTRSAGKLARNALGPGWTSSHRSFAEGFACRISDRVEKIIASDDDEKYGLVVIAKKTAIQQLMIKDDINVTVKKTTFKGSLDPLAAAAGAAAGDKIDLNFRKGIE